MLISCKKEYGFIVNKENEKPIKDVLVTDLDDTLNFVLTNEKGEFEFSKCGDLLITKNGFIADTIEKYGCVRNPHCFNGRGFYMEKNQKKEK